MPYSEQDSDRLSTIQLPSLAYRRLRGDFSAQNIEWLLLILTIYLLTQITSQGDTHLNHLNHFQS